MDITPKPINKTSSTNIKWVNLRDVLILNPLIKSDLVLVAINKLRPSIMKRKKMDERGQTCHKPLEILKKLNGTSLISTAKFVIEV